MEEANKLIGAGKKHLVMGQVVKAVSCLQEACDTLAKKYGDTADECGEAFFWCGKALLDLARMENSVLGNALEGVPEGDDDDQEKPKDSNVESAENVDEKTRDELRVQVYDAMAEKKKEDEEKAAGEQGVDGGAQETKEEEDGKQSGNVGSKSNGGEDNDPKEGEKEPADEEKEPAEEAEGADDDEEEDGDDAEMEGEAEGKGEADEAPEKESGDNVEEEEEEDEEVGNLQLAWEMLEVAKVIYKRKEAKEDQLMAAQAHLKLGEVSVESGNYSQAVEDFQECLKLQLKHLDSNSRLLAETHYQLGLTFSLNLQHTEAIAELNNSIAVIKNILEKLTEQIDEAADAEALPQARKEVEELRALLPEIQEKVEDATEGLKMTSTYTEAVKDALDGATTSSAFPASNGQNGSSSSTSNGTSSANAGSANAGSAAPVSDISHLVRKKRKPEESPVKEGEVKKVKHENGHCNGAREPLTNGVHKANGDSNGHANGMEVEK